ncbi:hypothetical protein M422DRAFT_243680 [Sphaerobolus stellatus SS14]|nr:hypothetical protein M422DRAFT_243680 [Sphaerobolus stellatus SS14]
MLSSPSSIPTLCISIITMIIPPSRSPRDEKRLHAFYNPPNSDLSLLYEPRGGRLEYRMATPEFVGCDLVSEDEHNGDVSARGDVLGCGRGESVEDGEREGDVGLEVGLLADGVESCLQPLPLVENVLSFRDSPMAPANLFHSSRTQRAALFPVTLQIEAFVSSEAWVVIFDFERGEVDVEVWGISAMNQPLTDGRGVGHVREAVA